MLFPFRGTEAEPPTLACCTCAELQTFAEYERLEDSLSTDATNISASRIERSQFEAENFDFCNSLNSNSEEPPDLKGDMQRYITKFMKSGF